jgi:hypothetical protein
VLSPRFFNDGRRRGADAAMHPERGRWYAISPGPPYGWTADFFNRDPSTLSRDIRAFETSLARDRGLCAQLRQLADRL